MSSICGSHSSEQFVNEALRRDDTRGAIARLVAEFRLGDLKPYGCLLCAVLLVDDGDGDSHRIAELLGTCLFDEEVGERATVWLAYVRFVRGEQDENILSALSRFPQSAAAHTFMAELLGARGRAEVAEEHARRAGDIELFPRNMLFILRSNPSSPNADALRLECRRQIRPMLETMPAPNDWREALGMRWDEHVTQRLMTSPTWDSVQHLLIRDC